MNFNQITIHPSRFLCQATIYVPIENASSYCRYDYEEHIRYETVSVLALSQESAIRRAKKSACKTLERDRKKTLKKQAAAAKIKYETFDPILDCKS